MSSMPGIRNLSLDWWDAADPTSAVSLSAATYIGGRFQITKAGRIFGARVYLQAGDTWRHWCILEDRSTSDIVAARCYASVAQGPSDGWRNVWFHPVVQVAVGDDYYCWNLCRGVYFRSVGALGVPVERNNILYINSMQTTSIDPTSITPTMNTNANGVDLIVDYRKGK